MSYRCEECGNQVKPGIRSYKKVIETRMHQHTEVVKLEGGREKVVNKGIGSQIVKELTICPSCKVKKPLNVHC